MSGLNDTSPEAEAVLLQLLRQAPISRKMQMMEQLNQMARTVVLAELRRQYPEADEKFLRYKLAERILGTELAQKILGERIDTK